MLGTSGSSESLEFDVIHGLLAANSLRQCHFGDDEASFDVHNTLLANKSKSNRSGRSSL